MALSAQDDPWPVWGRTSSRLANTTTTGPRTPSIEWIVRFSDVPSETIREESPVLNREGILALGTARGSAAIDTATRDRLWESVIGGGQHPPAVVGDRLVVGFELPQSRLICASARTGKENWTIQVPDSFFDESPVIGSDDVVYLSVGAVVDDRVIAVRLTDGSEVWSTDVSDNPGAAPSLDEGKLLTASGEANMNHVTAFDPAGGANRWSFRTGRDLNGTSVISGDRVYVGSADRFLYCLDAGTGEEIWRFWCEQINRGAVALGHDGTIYTATTGNEGILFAVSPDGKRQWRYPLRGLVFNAPIVDGNGVIYVTTSSASGRVGWVEAINPDGTELWTREMPDMCNASPMLAPDGTLYIVCRDKNLYAFRDPPREVATLTDITFANGERITGGRRRLNESDDRYLTTQSEHTTRISEPNILDMIVGATTSIQDVTMLDVFIESRIDNPAAVVDIRLRNWATGEFESVHTYTIGFEEGTRYITGLDPANHVRGADGRIEVSVRTVAILTFTASGFRQDFDLLQINVR